MIIKGKARTYPNDLAAHLLRTDENERVEIMEMRGVAGGDLHEAICEMDALKTATKASKGLYHAMINIRADEQLTEAQWLQAVDALEERLGFEGQPRALVRHVKEGREHWHIVWARTDLERCRTIPVSHNYRAHEEVARALEKLFSHERVEGVHVGREGDRPERSPDAWEMQQQKRNKVSIQAVERDVRAVWAASDSPQAFQNALEFKGLILARGERRNFVIVDIEGGVHSLSRRLGNIRAKSLRGYLGALPHIPNVEEAREMQRQRKRARGEAGGDSASALTFTFKDVKGDLLGTRSFFTVYQLERLLKAKGCANVHETMRDILADKRLLRLTDPASGRLVGFTTIEARVQEERILEIAGRMAGDNAHRVREAVQRYVVQKTGLSLEQAEALKYALDAGAIKMIEGRAGTGKSYLLSALHEAAILDGYELVGLAPTNAVASDLAKAGYEGARTVHSLLWWMENRPDHANAQLHKRSMLVVDEAAMLSTDMTEKLLCAAEAAGAKVVLVGDSRQLSSVERGGIYADLSARLGAASLTNIRRQNEDWSRKAATDFATGNFEDGLKAYDKRGLIHWSSEYDDAKADLIKAWARDTESGKGGDRFVFAYTNKDADSLNSALHKLEVERGRVTDLVQVETTRGTREFGTGDRIQFRANEKRDGILNGGLGTIESVHGKTLHIKTDAGRTLAVDTNEFKAIDHGYAGTIYRGQGKTLDQSYVLHSHHWRDASSYVAMTRARDDTKLFVAKSHAEDIDALSRQMQRQQNQGSTLKYEAEPVYQTRRPEKPELESPQTTIPERDQGETRINASKAPEPKQEFNRLSMALDLKDGLEQLKLEAKLTEQRRQQADHYLSKIEKASEKEKSSLSETFKQADDANKKKLAHELDRLKEQQAENRKQITAGREEPKNPVNDLRAEARQRQIDEMKERILEKLRQDRNRGRGREI